MVLQSFIVAYVTWSGILQFSETSFSKAGRPPTRKLSDRKAYTRQKHTAISAATDFLGSYAYIF